MAGATICASPLARTAALAAALALAGAGPAGAETTPPAGEVERAAALLADPFTPGAPEPIAIAPKPNPGPQADLDAELVEEREVPPSFNVEEPLRRFAQTPDFCQIRPVENADAPCLRPVRAPLVALLRRAPAWYDAWVDAPAGLIYAARSELSGDGAATLWTVARFTLDGSAADAIRLRLPAGDGGFTAGDAVYIATAGGAKTLMSIDTRSRCGDETRRLGLLLQIDWARGAVDWSSALNVAGSGNFAFTEDRVYAVDGGSCEKDYLYEIDRADGSVAARNVLPIAMGSGGFIALEARDLHLFLYDRYRRYRLR